MKHSSPAVMAKALRSVFRRLKSIPTSEPELTSQNWCEVQPCVKMKIASREIILTQPLSSFLVYALGLLAIGAGLYFFWIRDSQASRLWWGISLLLWGIGALLAGTSYQAFGYEIKCAGRPYCAWTSWWEVTYLMFQQASMSAMLVAVAYSCTWGTLQTLLFAYALINAAVYTICTFVGGVVPIKSLITFELMLQVASPIVLIFVVLNSWRYWQAGETMDLVLLGTWAFLVLTCAVYFVYDHLDVTQRLWARGDRIWFSQNDVLHVGLILWVVFIVTVVANRVRDYAEV